MESPEKFVRGSVKISVSGEQIERFLNLCRARGLLLENVRLPEEKKLTARISIADFKKLAPIHSKTHVRIHILEKRGLPFFLYRSWRRKCFHFPLNKKQKGGCTSSLFRAQRARGNSSPEG